MLLNDWFDGERIVNKFKCVPLQIILITSLSFVGLKGTSITPKASCPLYRFGFEWCEWYFFLMNVIWKLLTRHDPWSIMFQFHVFPYGSIFQSFSFLFTICNGQFFHRCVQPEGRNERNIQHWWLHRTGLPSMTKPPSYQKQL